MDYFGPYNNQTDTTETLEEETPLRHYKEWSTTMAQLTIHVNVGSFHPLVTCNLVVSLVIHCHCYQWTVALILGESLSVVVCVLF